MTLDASRVREGDGDGPERIAATATERELMEGNGCTGHCAALYADSLAHAHIYVLNSTRVSTKAISPRPRQASWIGADTIISWRLRKFMLFSLCTQKSCHAVSPSYYK